MLERSLCVVALMSVAPAALAQATAPLSPAAAVDRARELQAAGEGETARDLLREAAEAHPDSELLALARAESYLAEDNDFWAIKVLVEFAENHPPACQARMFKARIEIDQAALDQADATLAEPGCEEPEEIRARALVLRAVIAQAREDDEAARTQIGEAQQTGRRYEEDAALLDALSAAYGITPEPAFDWKLDLSVGWTSNGLAGSPVDRVSQEGASGSALATVNARLGWHAPSVGILHPLAEARWRETELFAESARGLSTREPGLRLGATLGNEAPRLTVTYGYEVVQVQEGDRYEPGPLLYSEGHRGEYELEASDTWFAFGGGGHRRFREAGRTRWEFEQGLAAAFAPSDSTRLMVGASARFYDAQNDAYDVVGATGLAHLSVAFPHGFELRESVSLSGDAYTDSWGFFPGAPQEERQDVLFRTSAALWSPSTAGLKGGLEYGYTSRASTATPYSYHDHRLLLRMSWNYDSEQLGVSRISADGRVPLRHGLDPNADQPRSDERVRELMRQDEDVRRGSSCLK